MTDNIVVFTGGFDPVHSGHISCIKESRKFGRVIIGLNSDEWLTRKKGKPFMLFEERKAILDQFKDVLCVIDFDDSDNSACDAIQKVKGMFPKNKIIFANGGDRTRENIPEIVKFKDDSQVEFAFSVGGENKKNSSSWILNEWKHPSENRGWGKFLTYYDSKFTKVKRLMLDPGKSISMQYHNNRSELWFIESGKGEIRQLNEHNQEVTIKQLKLHDYFSVPVNTWHKLMNTDDQVLSVIEIQFGTICDESDIVRF